LDVDDERNPPQKKQKPKTKSKSKPKPKPKPELEVELEPAPAPAPVSKKDPSEGDTPGWFRDLVKDINK
jgi:hypothetical protein